MVPFPWREYEKARGKAGRQAVLHGRGLRVANASGGAVVGKATGLISMGH